MLVTTQTNTVLKEALKLGQSIWYDGLIAKPELERMIREDGLRGATTNPVILEKAIAGGSYDSEIAKLAKAGASDDEICKALAVKTVQDVCDVFKPVYDQTAGQDGFVSIEVNPHHAYDTDATIKEAKELYQRVARKNVMIKIPATRQGLGAIENVLSEGISVNITLIFSVERYREVMNAFFGGLERRVAAGQKIEHIASVASFFVSRVDSAVDKALEQKAAGTQDKAQQQLFKSLIGKTAIANSKVAYEAFEHLFAEPRYKKLKSKGAQVQRPLWASTGTKNPAYSDVLYVESLIGPNTVDTMPPATLDAFRDHGRAQLTLTEGVDDAHKTLEKVAFTGIALSQVTVELEKAGVDLFIEAYDKIIQRIREKKK
jgi:transaldolase